MAKAFLYVIGACTIAIIPNFVQADYKQDFIEYSRNLCVDKLGECRKQLAEGYYDDSLAASDDDLNALCDGKLKDNRATKCMIACEMQVRGWMDERGLFQKSGYVGYMEGLPHKTDTKYWRVVENAADSCNSDDNKRLDECETAYLTFKCLENECKKNGYDAFGLHYLTYMATVYV